MNSAYRSPCLGGPFPTLVALWAGWAGRCPHALQPHRGALCWGPLSAGQGEWVGAVKGPVRTSSVCPERESASDSRAQRG